MEKVPRERYPVVFSTTIEGELLFAAEKHEHGRRAWLWTFDIMQAAVFDIMRDLDAIEASIASEAEPRAITRHPVSCGRYERTLLP